MCGITGFVFEDNLNIEQGLDTLVHRGPDEAGMYQDDHCTLGIRRLSIIDVANGHQPCFSEAKDIVSVFNGQIYNHKELRQELIGLGHSFLSNSDSEIIPHLFEVYGKNFVHYLRGMFAIAIWDTREKRLFLYRDRMGKKPLLYSSTQQGGLVFSSELKTLMSYLPSDSRAVSTISLQQYLHFGYVPHPNSIFSGISKLPPGSMLEFSGDEVLIERYWEPKFGLDKCYSTSHESQLDSLLRNAVKIRLESERPTGSFLSGGIDSSLVSSYMAEFEPAKLQTFSIGFENSKYDETEYANFVASVIGSQHHVKILVASDVKKLFSSMFDYYDEPFADSSSLATFALSQFAAEHVTVALSGDGGDEVFGGYDRYRYTRRAKRYISLLKLSQNLAPFFEKIGNSKMLRVSEALGSIDRIGSKYDVYRMMMIAISDQDRRKLSPKSFSEDPRSVFLELMQSQKNLTIEDSSNLYDLKSYLPDDLMYKVDIASMAHSLEVRSPMLDQDVVEFGLKLIANERYGKEGKEILKRIAELKFGATFSRRPKMGFGIPKDDWLRGPLLENVIESLNPKTSQFLTQWFEHDVLEKILRDFLSGKRNLNNVWTLLCLENWAKRWAS
jgi:asparagine synthase (glutamine-hydrolysing)